MGRFLRAEAALAAAVAGRARRRLTVSLLVFALPFAPCRIHRSKGRSIRMRRRRGCQGFSEPPQARSTGPTPTAQMGAARLCWGPSPLLAGTGESASALQQKPAGLFPLNPGESCTGPPSAHSLRCGMLVTPVGQIQIWTKGLVPAKWKQNRSMWRVLEAIHVKACG